jgi:molybdopterin-dependent oxidoreductase alpha subunit
MGRPRVGAGGGFPALAYVLRKGRQAGGLVALYRRLASRNACKACALGMGGQQGGMTNEAGHFPEVCKKSVQAQAADMHAVVDEAFLARTSLAQMQAMSSRQLEAAGRLAFPLVAERGATHFRRIGWDELLARAGAAFGAARPDETFFYSSGRSSNEAGFLMQLVARAYGTNNVNNCSYYCHAASGVALSKIYGSGTSSLSLDDLESADFALLAGCNPASNHPRLMTQLMRLRRRGGRILVVNPLRELGLVRFRVPSDPWSLLFGTRIADLYLQPHAGADVALFKALLKGLVEAGGVDRRFVANHTTGWDEVRADLEASSWDDLAHTSGVGRSDLDAAVEMILGARRGIFMWAMGLTHHAWGTDAILALGNLALARGWLGRPGAGLLPIRGHSNVQGLGTVGVTPALKDAFARRLHEVYGVAPLATPGLDTYAAMEAAQAGRIRAALLLGGNLWGSNPDGAWARAALDRVGTILHLSTKLNQGHVHGRGGETLIAPVLARDEEAQPTTQESMFNFVRLSDGGRPARVLENRGGAEGAGVDVKSEVEILAALAERILPPGRFDWSRIRSHRELRARMADVVPDMAALADIDDRDGPAREFTIPGRVLHAPRFATPTGRAAFQVPRAPDATRAPDELTLITLRSEGQFNTVVYEDEDLYRGNQRRDVVMISAEDAARVGAGEGDRVWVETTAGRMEVSVAIAPIRTGNIAMYYPEANALVPRRLDPQSKTPAFKSVPARVRPAGKRVSALATLGSGRGATT